VIDRFRPRTLRARITLWYTAFLSLLLVALGSAAFVLLDRGLRQNVDASLLTVARVAAQSTREPSRMASELEDALESMVGPALAERFFQLLDPLGRPDPRLLPRHPMRLPLGIEALRQAENGRDSFETVHVPGVEGPLRLLTYPVVEGGRVVHLVQVAMPLEPVERARSRFLLILLGLAPLAIGAASAGGWFLARRALAPLDAMVGTARRIEAEDLSRRIETTGSGDELDRLAGVLNEMLGRLESSFAAVRQFSADAAHELRTPLTILMGEIEVALRSVQSGEEDRRVLASSLEEVNRLARLVDDLLFLARADAAAEGPALARVDLAAVLDEVTPAVQALAEAGGVRLAVDRDGPLWVNGNAPMLFRLVFNLGENAVKYTPRGGAVTMRAGRVDGAAQLEVRDSGPGIPAAEQDRVFDRFYRADRARERGGAGLGLALVRSILTMHGGQIRLESTPPSGTAFIVSLRSADPE
jgi:heavy metal sensor kinase